MSRKRNAKHINTTQWKKNFLYRRKSRHARLIRHRHAPEICTDFLLLRVFFFFVYWILYNSTTQNVWQHRPEKERIEIFAELRWNEASLSSREKIAPICSKMVVIWPKSLNCLMLIISITPFSSFTRNQRRELRAIPSHDKRNHSLSGRLSFATTFLIRIAERTNRRTRQTHAGALQLSSIEIQNEIQDGKNEYKLILSSSRKKNCYFSFSPLCQWHFFSVFES